MARLIHPDGTIDKVFPKGKKWTLKELQIAVDGTIEFVPGLRTLKVVVDEEGLLKSKPLNPTASSIVKEALLENSRGMPLRYIPNLVGDVLIFDPGEKM